VCRLLKHFVSTNLGRQREPHMDKKETINIDLVFCLYNVNIPKKNYMILMI